MANPRETNGPKEGEPGETFVVTMTDVLPPAVMMATVEEDGYFSDGLYEQMDQIRKDFKRRSLRAEMDEDDDG